VTEQIKTTVKTKKGKTRTVTKTITNYVVADFAWKDPIAAQKAGMSLKDYVIGGMDRLPAPCSQGIWIANRPANPPFL
jgi:hypothetical protein